MSDPSDAPRLESVADGAPQMDHEGITRYENLPDDARSGLGVGRLKDRRESMVSSSNSSLQSDVLAKWNFAASGDLSLRVRWRIVVGVIGVPSLLLILYVLGPFFSGR